MSNKDRLIITLLSEETLKNLTTAAASTPPGSFVEVGVWYGGSAYFLAEVARKRRNTPLYLYDTFHGIPYKDGIDHHDIGEFAGPSVEDVLGVVPDAIVVKGTFPGSAIEMGPIAFAHIDCDQYRSVRESALYLQDRMVPGGIMWFDDYDALEGARAAVNELYNGRVRFSGGKALVFF